ncbi:CbiQ family ECF transporter T component [Streptomyces carpaticus]|uniref:CbiQ family ECF transporter T component n=1 Tax=Streptomyces carpaticus TaxID=285558 RepID=UPI0031F7C6BB
MITPLPRALHPGAWWLWALGLAVAASRTTNPVLLLLIIAVAGYVVVSRRTDAPWALSFRMYLLFGAFIVVMRVLFRIVFGGGQGSTILFTLPEIPLPEAAAGIRLLGPVAAEQLLGGVYDGLQLAAMVICIGAANALANPKRLLKSLPGALYEIGTSVVVALTVAPQLIESVQRVRRARRLRGASGKGRGALRGILIPVLEDALNRSLALAAAMASRGYGRVGATPARTRLLTGLLVIGGLLGVCAGLYGTLDPSASRLLGLPLLLGGSAVAVAGFLLGGRRVRRTSYRPDRWRGAELLTAAAGLGAGALMYVSTRVDPANLYPSLSPLSWPEVAALPVAAILVGLLPAFLTPSPPPPAPAVPQDAPALQETRA